LQNKRFFVWQFIAADLPGYSRGIGFAAGARAPSGPNLAPPLHSRSIDHTRLPISLPL